MVAAFMSSPPCRLVEMAVAITHPLRKLACLQYARPNLFEEVGVGVQDPAGVLLRIQDADLFAQFSAHQPDRLQQIGIVGDHDSRVEAIHMRIMDKVGGDIDIRSLLLGLDHGGISVASGWMRQRHADLVRKEMPIDDGHHGFGQQRADIHLLPIRLIEIAGTRLDPGSVVFDGNDIIVWQKQAAHLGDVQPAVGRALDGAVVEVEAVDIDDGAIQTAPPKKQKPLGSGFAPCAEATGVICRE